MKFYHNDIARYVAYWEEENYADLKTSNNTQQNITNDFQQLGRALWYLKIDPMTSPNVGQLVQAFNLVQENTFLKEPGKRGHQYVMKQCYKTTKTFERLSATYHSFFLKRLSLFRVPLVPSPKLRESEKRVSADASAYLALSLWMKKSHDEKTKLLGYVLELAVLTGYRIETLRKVTRDDFKKVPGTDQLMTVTKRESK